MIEGGSSSSKLGGGGSPSNGKYTPDFSSSSSKSYRPESKTPRQMSFYPARGAYRVDPYQGDPASRSASSSREESDYMDTTANNGVRMPPPQKRQDLFTRSISWDAKFRSKDRSPNNSNSSNSRKVSNPSNPNNEDRYSSNDWRGGRHSRRRHRGAGGMLSSESRIPRPKLRPRLADSAEEPMDFQTTDVVVRQGDGVKSPVTASLPALQQQQVVPEVHRNCKSEVLIPRFKQEGGPVYMQPR